MAGEWEDEMMRDALAHYGVKGMKWGVRKKDDVTRAEKKQEKRDVKIATLTAQKAKNEVYIKELDDKIAATPKKISTAYARNELRKQRNAAVYNDKHLTKSIAAVKEGRLTPNQKALIASGALATVAVLGVYGTAKVQSGEFNSLRLRGAAALRRKDSIFDKNSDFANAKTPDDLLAVMYGINPAYNTPGGQMNCRRCSFTYELRRRGYDVVATTSPSGWGQSETGLLNALSPKSKNINRIDSLTQNVSRGLGIRNKAFGDNRKSIGDRFTVKDAKDRMSFIDAFKDQPDGARGESVFNFGAFAHSLSYEKMGGKVYIFDTQKGKRYDTSNELEYRSFLLKWGERRVKDVQITRLDNLDLDEKFLARWVTNTPSQQKAVRERASKEIKRRAEELKRQAEVRRTMPAKRPANMHITKWNALKREAGLL